MNGFCLLVVAACRSVGEMLGGAQALICEATSLAWSTAIEVCASGIHNSIRFGVGLLGFAGYAAAAGGEFARVSAPYALAFLVAALANAPGLALAQAPTITQIVEQDVGIPDLVTEAITVAGGVIAVIAIAYAGFLLVKNMLRWFGWVK